MCRKHMRHTRGCESSADRREKIPTLFVDKVAIQKDILAGKLGILDIHNEGREEIPQELDSAKNRWGSERCKSGIAKSYMPLLTSTEWGRIHIHEMVG